MSDPAVTSNPYRDALKRRPQTWRNLLAGELVVLACRIGRGQVGALCMSAFWADGWRPVAEPEPGPKVKPRTRRSPQT